MEGRLSAVIVRRGTASLALVFSCATQQRESANEGASTHVIVEAQPSGTPPRVAGGEPPPHAANVHIVNVAPGRFLLDADAPTDVATAATLVHRSAEGQWVPEPYELRESCTPLAAGTPQCRPISSEASFAPLSSNGTPCGPCCADQNPTPIASGTYRLTLTACSDPRVQWNGPSFEMPPATDAVERWRATSGVQKVSLFRIGVDRSKHTTARERSIAGYTILQGAPASLSDSLVGALIDWLRDPAAFSDAVMPRCFPGKRFGFRMARDIPKIGHELSEIAVDLAANRS